MQTSSARTITVASPNEPSTLTYRWPTAEPDEVQDYSIDINTVLTDISGDLQSVSASVAPSGEFSLSNLTSSNGVITVWGQSGLPGRRYKIRLNATTFGGFDFEFFIHLSISKQTAIYPLHTPANSGFSTAITWNSGDPVLFGADTAVATNLVATGSMQSDALLLLAQTNVFSTVPVGSGCVLNAAHLRGTCRIINASSNDLLVYPPGTAHIGTYTAGTPVIVSPGNGVDFVTSASTVAWYGS